MSWSSFDSTAPADTYGDYAVDHGHADNEAYQSGGYTGWLDSAPWVLCTTHSVQFPAGQEEAHKAGPCGEQNSTGRCAFTSLAREVTP